MPVRKTIPDDNGIYFITFTCYRWLPLIELTNGYVWVYKWFDYLNSKGHSIAGYVIMPNHLHVMISFIVTDKKINKIIGDGKRFIAYEIIKRIQEKNLSRLLKQLQRGVSSLEAQKGKRHEVWEESFDWKRCETPKFAYQKLIYMHNNPCRGKWKLVEDITEYPHSSARFYISNRHAAYAIKDIETIFFEKL